MKVKEIKLDALEEGLYRNKNVIYGAGYNGKLLFELCSKKNIRIDAFYDDDESRWGEPYCTKNVLSKEELTILDKNTTNILIANQYTEQIIEKVKNLGFENIYTVLDKIIERDTEVFHFNEYQTDEVYHEELNKLIGISEDRETKQYFEMIRKTVLCGKAINEIRKLYCAETQYFLDCFHGVINDCSFIDAGAYTGDTICAMLEKGIHPSEVYSFEADINNYIKLEKFFKKAVRNDNWHCENYALWDVHTKLGMKFGNFQSKVDAGKDALVEAITIDEYFETIKVGFVKMDIEGAERKALAGGMKVIRRDRPILAISIYHSLDDIVEIPKMLMNDLNDYDFFIRKHANTYAEAILYAVPKELDIKY